MFDVLKWELDMFYLRGHCKELVSDDYIGVICFVTPTFTTFNLYKYENLGDNVERNQGWFFGSFYLSLV